MEHLDTFSGAEKKQMPIPPSEGKLEVTNFNLQSPLMLLVYQQHQLELKRQLELKGKSSEAQAEFFDIFDIDYSHARGHADRTLTRKAGRFWVEGKNEQGLVFADAYSRYQEDTRRGLPLAKNDTEEDRIFKNELVDPHNKDEVEALYQRFINYDYSDPKHQPEKNRVFH